MITVSDKNYRSHALPCYPMDEKERRAFIKGLEGEVCLSVTDKDYGMCIAEHDFLGLQLAA